MSEMYSFAVLLQALAQKMGDTCCLKNAYR